jgi:uncharacterized surface protein with fasciclin (FAS1) repeats
MRFLSLGRKAAIAAVAASLGLFIADVAQADPNLIADGHGGASEAMSEDDMAGNTIVDIAVGNDSFGTLVQAVQAAGLVETLSGPGPFTVFAPTNDAFSQLPDGALEFLLQPENQDILIEVLQYHVVPGAVMSGDLSTGSVETLKGGIAVAVNGSSVILNNASVMSADIEASNGVIHVVNRVLLSNTLQERLAAQLGLPDIY